MLSQPVYAQPIPQANELENARLALNENIASQAVLHARIRQCRGDLRRLAGVIEERKERRRQVANEEFEKRQAKAKADHAKRLGELDMEEELNGKAEQLKIQTDCQNFEVEAPNGEERLQAARKVYNKLYEDVTEAMNRRTAEHKKDPRASCSEAESRLVFRFKSYTLISD